MFAHAQQRHWITWNFEKKIPHSISRFYRALNNPTEVSNNSYYTCFPGLRILTIWYTVNMWFNLVNSTAVTYCLWQPHALPLLAQAFAPNVSIAMTRGILQARVTTTKSAINIIILISVFPFRGSAPASYVHVRTYMLCKGNQHLASVLQQWGVQECQLCSVLCHTISCHYTSTWYCLITNYYRKQMPSM